MLVLNEVLEGDLQAGRGLLFIWDSVPSGDTSPLQHRVLCQELGLWSLMEGDTSPYAVILYRTLPGCDQFAVCRNKVLWPGVEGEKGGREKGPFLSQRIHPTLCVVRTAMRKTR